jgi:hypothetical protein
MEMGLEGPLVANFESLLLDIVFHESRVRGRKERKRIQDGGVSCA